MLRRLVLPSMSHQCNVNETEKMWKEKTLFSFRNGWTASQHSIVRDMTYATLTASQSRFMFTYFRSFEWAHYHRCIEFESTLAIWHYRTHSPSPPITVYFFMIFSLENIVRLGAFVTSGWSHSQYSIFNARWADKIHENEFSCRYENADVIEMIIISAIHLHATEEFFNPLTACRLFNCWQHILSKPKWRNEAINCVSQPKTVSSSIK